MKKLLLSILFLLPFTVNAQCFVHFCDTIINVSGSVTGKSYNKSFCFMGNATIETSVNFNNWDYLQFGDSITIKQTLNMNGKRKLYFTGVDDAKFINMDGQDSIWVDNKLTVDKLVTNNSTVGKENVIFISGSYVTLEGKNYAVGDTFFGPGNISNKVLILECKSVALPLNLLMFDAKSVNGTIHVNWMLADKNNKISMYYSNNGITWDCLNENAIAPYVITNVSTENFIKIKSEDEYSETIRIVLDVTSTASLIYDINGNRLDKIPYNQAFIIKGNPNKQYIVK